MLRGMSSGMRYGMSSEVSAFSALPRPLDCSITAGRAPPRYSPAATPKASSSRVAVVVRMAGNRSRRTRSTCDVGLSGTWTTWRVPAACKPSHTPAAHCGAGTGSIIADLHHKAHEGRQGIRGEMQSSESDLHVLRVGDVDAVHEPDLVRLVLHDHRAGARAVAEEPDAAHQRAVGDAGGGEDDALAWRQIARAVNPREILDAHRTAACFVLRRVDDQPREN